MNKENEIKPTEQQLYCVKVSQEEKMVKIVAAAGAGKTSTLVLISEVIVEPSLYMAFNKAIAEEASGKFPRHVECRTGHSIAFASHGRELSHKLARPKGAYKNVAGTGSEIAKYYKLDGVQDVVTAAAVGAFVKRTVERFSQSDAQVVSKYNLPKMAMEKLLATNPEYEKIVLDAAKKLWKDRTNPDSCVLASHDDYLKLFSLSKPTLPYSVIYVDEQQDSTPCFMAIILNQATTAKVVVVGDPFQAIYQWRGAVNALDLVTCVKAPLSMSFRYGEGIAAVATCVLGNKTVVEGRKDLSCVIGRNVVDRTKPYTYLFRTNAMLLQEAVSAIDKGEKIKVEIDVRDFVKQLQSAQALYDNDTKKVKHERITMFASWWHMTEEAKVELGELRRIVNIVENKQAQHIINVLEYYQAPEDYTAIYVTAHRSKGMEFDQVILADDFPSNYNKGTWKGLSQPEENLLYVALTRSMRVLEINNTIAEILDKARVKYIDNFGEQYHHDSDYHSDIKEAA